jgi:hypothetical protein
VAPTVVGMFSPSTVTAGTTNYSRTLLCRQFCIIVWSRPEPLEDLRKALCNKKSFERPVWQLSDIQSGRHVMRNGGNFVVMVSQRGFESLMLPFGHLCFLTWRPGQLNYNPCCITCLELYQIRESSPTWTQSIHTDGTHSITQHFMYNNFLTQHAS